MWARDGETAMRPRTTCGPESCHPSRVERTTSMFRCSSGNSPWSSTITAGRSLPGSCGRERPRQSTTTIVPAHRRSASRSLRAHLALDAARRGGPTLDLLPPGSPLAEDATPRLGAVRDLPDEGAHPLSQPRTAVSSTARSSAPTRIVNVPPYARGYYGDVGHPSAAWAGASGPFRSGDRSRTRRHAYLTAAGRGSHAERVTGKYLGRSAGAGSGGHRAAAGRRADEVVAGLGPPASAAADAPDTSVGCGREGGAARGPPHLRCVVRGCWAYFTMAVTTLDFTPLTIT